MSVPGISACDTFTSLCGYLDSLTIAFRGYDFNNLQQEIMTHTLSATTAFAIGTAVAVAPCLCGRDWIMSVLWVIAALLGAAGSAAFAQSSVGSNLLSTMDAEQGCLIGVAAIIICSLIVATAAVRTFTAAIFVVGAASAGYAASFACKSYDVPSDQQLLPIAAAALVGGFLARKLVGPLLDLVLGVLSCLMVAQGVLQIVASSTFLDAATVQKIRIEEFYVYYIVAVAAPLFLCRMALTSETRRSASSSPKRSHNEGLVMR